MSSRRFRETVEPVPFATNLSRVTATKPRIRRAREKRSRPELPGAVSVAQPAVNLAMQPDPVRIALLAMEGLARASARAAFTGIEVRVAVPDEMTAAIFRAVLAETRQTRATDRLIRVVVVD